MPENGVTRREFEELKRKVDNLDEHGSRRVGILNERIKNLTDELHETNGRINNLVRGAWAIVLLLIATLFTLIATFVAGTGGA